MNKVHLNQIETKTRLTVVIDTWSGFSVCLLLVCLFCSTAMAGEKNDALRIDVKANPSSLVKGKHTEANLSLVVSDLQGVPVSNARIDCLARFGSVVEFQELSPGKYTARYLVPKANYPQLEILVIRIPHRAMTWVRIPIKGRGVFRVQAEPNAKTQLTIGDETFGPVTTDKNGEARIPFAAWPGQNQGLLRSTVKGGLPNERQVKINVPRVQSLMARMEESTVVADGQTKNVLEIYLVDQHQQPLSGAKLQLQADRGSLSSAEMLAPGRYLARYTAPALVGDGKDQIKVTALNLGPGYQQNLLVKLTSGPATNLSFSIQPNIVKNPTRVVLQAQVTDANENPVNDVEVGFSISEGRLGKVQHTTPGRFHAWLTLDPSNVESESIEVTARAWTTGDFQLSKKKSIRLVRQTTSSIAQQARLPSLLRRPEFYIWTMTGLAVASSLAGAVLLAIDGKETCDAEPEVNCPQVYDTQDVGFAMLGTGTLFVTGALLVYWLVPSPIHNASVMSTWNLGVDPMTRRLVFSGKF